MIYLSSLRVPSLEAEGRFLIEQRRSYNHYYPFGIFPRKLEETLHFSNVTILYGSNGSGKTTLLNVLAEKLGVYRHSAFFGGDYFKPYVGMCRVEAAAIPPQSQILTSDDVSEYLLNIRSLNNGIDTRRSELFDDWLERKYKSHRFTSMADYDDWKESYDAKSLSRFEFVNERLMRNVDMRSNGETAMRYFVERIDKEALYLIDEPENSLAPPLQRELVEYIAASARAYRCQFVIATHSPFFLSLPGAEVYDLDSEPTVERKWTELPNVRAYYEFFEEHKKEFG